MKKIFRKISKISWVKKLTLKSFQDQDPWWEKITNTVIWDKILI